MKRVGEPSPQIRARLETAPLREEQSVTGRFENYAFGRKNPAKAIAAGMLWLSSAIAGGAAFAADDLGGYADAVKTASAPAAWNGPTEKAIAPKDKTVVVISCTWALSGCKVGAQAVLEAADKIGWKSRAVVVNDSTGYDQATQTAINSGADAIVFQGVQQTMASGGLALAKQKHVPVVSLFENNAGGEFGVAIDVHPDGDLIGKLLADSAIVKTGGKVHALFLKDAEFQLPITVLAAVQKELDACKACTVTYADPINFTAGTMGTTLPDRVVGAMRRDATINSIFIGYDPPTPFIVPALDVAGFRGKVAMYSQLGNAAPLAHVRDDNIMFSDVGSSEPWGAWGCIDELIRLLNGQPLVDEKVPAQLFTQTAVANIPAPGVVYDGADSGFKDKYLALWGH